jgi:hypothetical protein
MPRFRASEPIYLSNERRLIAAGEIFTSDEIPGRAWIPLDTAPPAAGAKARRTATQSSE